MLQYFSPLAWLRWCGQFVASWFATVPWGLAPRAVPAIILMIVMGVTGVVALTNTSNWRGELLNRQLQSALDKDDFQTAEVVLERQLGRRPNDSELAYRLAVSRDAQGKTAEAYELMRRLVQVKRYEPAARWLLHNQFEHQAEAKALTAKQKFEYGELLELIHKESPDDVQMKLWYVKHLLSVQRYPQAIPLMVEMSNIEPMFRLQAAILERSLGNESTATRYAEETLSSVKKLSEEDPTNSTLSIAVVQNQLFLKRYADAVATLDAAIVRTSSDTQRNRLKQAMGDTIVAWVRDIEGTADQSAENRLRVLKLLQTGLHYAPENPRVLSVVSDHVLATLDEDDDEISAVREALIGGTSTGIAHFIRGTAALMKDDIESATVSLQLAAEHLPQSAAILNNLAVALTMRGEKHLGQALKLSEESIKRAPRVTPYFYETRGQILYRMGKYLEAIPDLERALQVQAIALEAHRSLAVCYEKIGEAELGKLHSEAASKLALHAEPASTTN